MWQSAGIGDGKGKESKKNFSFHVGGGAQGGSKQNMKPLKAFLCKRRTSKLIEKQGATGKSE